VGEKLSVVSIKGDVNFHNGPNRVTACVHHGECARSFRLRQKKRRMGGQNMRGVPRRLFTVRSTQTDGRPPRYHRMGMGDPEGSPYNSERGDRVRDSREERRVIMAGNPMRRWKRAQGGRCKGQWWWRWWLARGGCRNGVHHLDDVKRGERRG